MSFPDRNIALVCNPFHEKALKVTENIALLLAGMDVQYEVFDKTWPDEWSLFSEAWIVGGDGTLNYFINRNADIKIPLAVFAGGTGNDFCFMLYGDQTIESQVEAVLMGAAKGIDAGRCNEKIFLNNLGIGFDAKVSKDLIGKKKRSGKSSYLLTILKNIFFFKEFEAAIESKILKAKQKCFMISVANGKRTGGGFYLAPDAFLDDGLLNVNVVGGIHPLKRIRYLQMIEKGKHTHLSFINYFTTNSISIQSAETLDVHVDGEYFTGDNFTVECLAKKYLFIC